MRRPVELNRKNTVNPGPPTCSHRDYGFVAFLPQLLEETWPGKPEDNQKTQVPQGTGSSEPLPLINYKVVIIVAQESKSVTADVASWLS